MTVLLCHGTRPEEVKMLPIHTELERRGVAVQEYKTVQNKDLVTGKAGVSWDSLTTGIANTMKTLKLYLSQQDVDLLLVQGDTATAFACALTGFLEGVPVAHVEAGLRTYDVEPYPEEALRQMIASVATLHFCPDAIAANNVFTEVGPHARVFIVGNTVVDALEKHRPLVLVTLHRRENWGERMVNALGQLNDAALHPSFPDIQVVTHPNWKVWLDEPPKGLWPKLTFLDPMPHSKFVPLLRRADLVVTDSGGLQEEAAYYGKPTIVYRTSTERVALASAGAVQLAKPDSVDDLSFFVNRELHKRTQYGTGDAAKQIVDTILEYLHG